MTESPALSAALTRRILHHFELPAELPPDLDSLGALLHRYTRTVPWESASRIVRRAHQANSEDCVLLGEGFWHSHFAQGTGGTCYESNYAFFGLLRRLGYEGYLTINDMGAALGCHSAIVVALAGQKYLVDVGYPVHALLPLSENGDAHVENAIMDYAVEPLGASRYAIWREIQPRASAFQLNDKAVSDADYRAIANHDYRPNGGQFLKDVIIHKVVDDQLWRFNGDERPLRLQQFVDGQRRDHILSDGLAGHLARKFGLAQDLVAEAMEILERDPN